MQAVKRRFGAGRHLYVRMLPMLLLAASTIGAFPQAVPNFTGVWKQDNDRCQPKRKGDVTLRIEQHGETLTVETTIAGTQTASRHALQKYSSDGKVSTSIGADGDTFNTSVVRQDGKLIFSIEEHEDGRILHSKEIWSLRENNAVLERIRERQNNDRQTLIYRRSTTVSADGNAGRSGGTK